MTTKIHVVTTKDSDNKESDKKDSDNKDRDNNDSGNRKRDNNDSVLFVYLHIYKTLLSYDK